MKTMATSEILTRARNAFKMGEYPLVEKLAGRILEEQPDSAIAYNLLGSVCEKTGRFRKAIELFQKAVDLKPGYTEAHNNLGVLFKRIEAYGEAIPHFERAIDLSPQRGDVYYNLGNVYKALKNNEQAEENFSKAIAVDPGFVPSYINLGTILESEGRYGDAIRIYQKGLQVDTSQPRLHYNLGVVYDKMRKLAEAREEYESAARARPGWADALNNLSIVQHRLGDERSAEKTLRNLLRAEPKNARALNNLGVVLAAQGRGEDAAQAYRDSMKADPRYGQALGNLAALLETEGKLSEALEELRRLLTLEPKNIEARLRLAGILRQLENDAEALEQYQSVLAVDAKNPEALKGLALLHARAGDTANALGCYKTLETIDTADQSFRIDRAALLKDTGKVEAAQEEVLRFLADNPESSRARILLADIHAKQGHLRQAAQTLIEVLEASPDETDASYRLSQLYRELGEPEKAIETIEGLINSLEQSTDPQDMDALSRAMEEYEKAIAEHEKDFRDDREKAIRKLRELSVDTTAAEKEKPEDDSLLIEEMEPLQEEEAVPIINVGGLEPVFAVREVDEELKLEEIDESIQEDAVSIEDERPPNLVNLLKDQELYEENPALAMFEQAPPFPPAGRGPQGGTQAPPAPAPAPLSPSPLTPAQLALSPQGESVIANSLKESVAAQSKVVDKLFDEMKELSRKVDEKRSAPTPPIVLNLQRGMEQQPVGPIVMDLPSAGPQPSGFPRYASSDTDEAERESDETVIGPRDLPETEGSREHGGPAAEESDVTLEEAPEDIEAAELEEVEELTEPAHPGPNASAERSALEPPAERAPPPRGWPGLEPITDGESEPEIDAARQETVEATEGGLEPLEEPVPTGPAPSKPDATLASGARSSDDVRKELRDYLNGVRDKLENGTGQAPAPASPVDLLDYLGKLSDYLPEREKKRFRGSNERLAMESLKARLSGKRGLRKKVSEDFPTAGAGVQQPMTRSRVVDTFSYLKDLAAWHPDKAVGAAMRDRIESIVARMGRLR